jgi:hypothetical protein
MVHAPDQLIDTLMSSDDTQRSNPGWFHRHYAMAGAFGFFLLVSLYLLSFGPVVAFWGLMGWPIRPLEIVYYPLSVLAHRYEWIHALGTWYLQFWSHVLR